MGDEDEDERGEAERYNDEHIAPQLLAIAEECHAHGLALVARVEWAPFEGQSTHKRVVAEPYSASLEMALLATRANGNLDAFLLALARMHKDGKLDLSQSMVSHWMKLEPFNSLPQPGGS